MLSCLGMPFLKFILSENYSRPLVLPAERRAHAASVNTLIFVPEPN